MLNQNSDDLGKQLLQALQRGWPRKAEKLIKAGANLDLRDASGNRAIDLAKKAGHGPLVDLISAKAKTSRAAKSNKK